MREPKKIKKKKGEKREWLTTTSSFKKNERMTITLYDFVTIRITLRAVANSDEVDAWKQGLANVS